MQNGGLNIKKIKPCKKCNKQRYANLSLCFQHYRQTVKEKRLLSLAKKKERSLRKKEKKANSPKALKKTLDTLVSLYVRRRASDSQGMATCITCGVKKHYKELQAGHYISRSNYSVRYDLRNIHVQCFKCNMKFGGCKGGNLVQYTKYLLNEHGEWWLRELIADGEKIKQWITPELKDLIEKYTELLRQMDNAF